MNIIFGDVETSCRLPGDPLDTHGSYRYSKDPSTRIESAVLGDANQTWLYDYYSIDQLKTDLRQLVDYSDCKFVFHYALFELSIFQNVLNITIPPSRVIDTYLMLGYYGYPRGLDKGAEALKCSQLKDLAGKESMMILTTGLYNPKIKPKEYEDLYRYNRIDVEVTREIYQTLPPLPEMVQRLWELDVRINMRGIPIDMQAVQNAIVLRDYLKNDADREMAELTGGKVQTVGQVKEIEKFALAHGVNMVDCTADTVRRTLETQIPDLVRKVLTLRQEAGLSSVAKFDQIANRQVSNRMYHEFDTYGCTTGRPKGRGWQALNLARATEADYLADILHHSPDAFVCMFPKPRQKLKESMRGMICAEPGHVLLGGDLGQIEARNTGWAAGDLKFLDLFATSDPYCTYGAKLWGHELIKEKMQAFEFLLKRTAAKATVLQMGFAGGIGASQRGAEQYNIDMDVLASIILPTATPAEWERGYNSYHKYYLPKKPKKPLTENQGIAADILKQRYRKDFARIAAYWDELWDAFVYGGQAGLVHIHAKDRLRILTLPNGRQLFYHDVRYHRKKKVYDPERDDELFDDDEDEKEEYWTYKARDRRKRLWKGVIMENVAQAINHDISTWYMLQADENIAPVIHQCYDEFTMHVPASQLEWAKEELAKLVKTQPDWTLQGARPLPIVFEIWSGLRYG